MLNDILQEAREKMNSTLHVFEEDLHGIRGNRASTALVDRLRVDYYGQETELRQLANISTPEPMTIMIRPFDKAATKAIEKAIQEANIGMNPNVDQGVIRLNMPALTRERRQELVKIAHQYADSAKVATRHVRRDGMEHAKKAEKDGDISQDDARVQSERVQKITDDTISSIDSLLAEKEAEIMQV